MKIFLVRHGEGLDSNTTWQTPETPLSDLGRRQAKTLINTHRFKNVEKILTSKFRRAQETAQIIGEGFSKDVEVVKGVEERQQSSKICGLSRADDVAEKYTQEVVKHEGDWDWKWDTEEESLIEVIARASKFKQNLIKNYISKDVVVVSHDIFLRCFISSCVLGEDFDKFCFDKFFKSIALEKTGITLLIYREEQKTWKLWYLNDYAHLVTLTKTL